MGFWQLAKASLVKRAAFQRPGGGAVFFQNQAGFDLIFTGQSSEFVRADGGRKSAPSGLVFLKE